MMYFWPFRYEYDTSAILNFTSNYCQKWRHSSRKGQSRRPKTMSSDRRRRRFSRYQCLLKSASLSVRDDMPPSRYVINPRHAFPIPVRFGNQASASLLHFSGFSGKFAEKFINSQTRRSPASQKAVMFRNRPANIFTYRRAYRLFSFSDAWL